MLSPSPGRRSSARARPPIVDSAEIWPEADRLFQSDLHWVGGDGALTTPLGGDRVAWLFGDSGVLTGEEQDRDRAAFIRNSVAIQTGLDPSTALMQFSWGLSADGPTSFVADRPPEWLWPGQGARVGDTLLLFYGIVAPSSADLGLPERDVDGVLAVSNPEAEPADWDLREVAVPSTGSIGFAAASFVDGDALVLAGVGGDAHDVYLMRFALADAAKGDLTRPSFYCGGGAWAEGCAPAVVIPSAAPELSMHYDPIAQAYLEFETTGFGATTLGVRRADRPEGPWSDVESFFVPPESEDACAFVYAGKAHPGLAGADVVLTYVPDVFNGCSSTDPTLYFPHFVRVTLERP